MLEKWKLIRYIRWLENISKPGTFPPTLEFINIEGEPSKAANDEAIRKLVRSNARRAGQRRKEAPPDRATQPLAPAAPTAVALPLQISDFPETPQEGPSSGPNRITSE